MSFMERSARRFLAIKAARQIKEEIEKAGLDNLKALAEAGKSILGIYLEGCSPEEKKRHRRDGNALRQMGVTPEMVLTELAGQIEELSSIMEKKKDYKKSELRNLEQFLKEES
ncbi:hypothetical protein ES703_08400 [subsurface metagenome]